MIKNKRLILKHLTGDQIVYDPLYALIMYKLRLAIASAAELYYKDHPEERNKLRHGEFTYLPLPDKSKWGNKEKIIDSSTGKELLPGDYVLARNGVLVTGDSLDWLDWLAETGLILPGENLPEVHIEYNKKTGDTRKYNGQSWDEMNAQKENADIATNSLWELIVQLNSEANSLINLEVLKRLNDRAANIRTPGIGSLALLGIIGPMAAWDPLAFAASLGAAKIGEATVNYPFLQEGYLSFGDWWLGPDASEAAKENANLGTWLAGGFGYGAARNLTNKFGLNLASNHTFLADKYASQWAKENILRQIDLQIINNYRARMPLFIEDVTATELGSYPLKFSSTTRRPGVFYTKTGEINKGSVAGAALGNWQIKALMPGNALERKVAPDGTVSWKDFEWYLKLKPVEPYDRIHLLRAAENFSRNEPIPYEQLKVTSSAMIPKFSKTTSDNLKGYGLDALGLGTKTDATEHYGFAKVVLPNEGVHPESIVFNNPIGEYTGLYTEGRVHFPHATLHMRGYTVDNEPGVYYYLEGQSDWGQQGLKHGDFMPGSIEEHMAETSLLRGIQEALLHAAETGNSVMRIPTPETVIKSLYWRTYLSPKGRELVGENSKLVNQQFEDFVATNYPELNRLRQVAIEAEHKYNMASKATRDYIRKLRSKYIIPEYVANSPEFYLHPEQYLKFSEGRQIAEDIRILRQAEADALVEYLSAAENSNALLRQARRDPRALEIEQLGKLEEEAIRSKYSTVDNTRQAIVNKYKAFPKHFRRLFGDKPEIRNVTDSKGNTWFEVDIPKDINTRDLIFSTLGDINEGSAAGVARGNWLIRSLMPGNPLSKRVSPTGRVSLKNIQWYLNSPNISVYDKYHIQKALRLLGVTQESKDVDYNLLLQTSHDLIPKLGTVTESEYSDYGLQRLGFESDLGLVKSFHVDPSIAPSHSAHYEDAFGHNRYLIDDDNPKTLNIVEVQNDAALRFKNSLDQRAQHMMDTFFLRQIQEAALEADANGMSKLRFPSRDTAAKVEGYQKDYLPQEIADLLEAFLNKGDDIIAKYIVPRYPSYLTYKLLNRNLQKQINGLYDLFDALRDIIRKQHGVSISSLPSSVLSLSEDYLGTDFMGLNHMHQLRVLAERINKLQERLADIYDRYIDALDAFHSDPRRRLVNRIILNKRLNFLNQYGDYHPRLKLILDRYESFPKQWRSLFGSKSKVNNVSDRYGNNWFEVDVPEDINTRNLIFSKIGDVNKGSTSGIIKNNWQIRSLMPRNPLEKRVNPEGLVSWNNLNWYIKLPNLSAYDKWHILQAASTFPLDLPIPYEQLLQESKKLIPKRQVTAVRKYAGYGLDRLGYNALKYNEQSGDFVMTDPGVAAVTALIKYPGFLVSNRHFEQGAFGHNRYFRNKNGEPILYVSEILSDVAQNSTPLSILELHLVDKFYPMLIQEAVRVAAKNNMSAIRFPKKDTAARIEGYLKKFTPRGQTELSNLESRAEDLRYKYIRENYPDFVQKEEQLQRIDSKYKQLQALERGIVRKIEDRVETHIVSSVSTLLMTRKAYGSDPDILRLFDALEEIHNEITSLRRILTGLLFDLSNMFDDLQSSDINLKRVNKATNNMKVQIRSKNYDYPLSYSKILGRYESFPKLWRNLFNTEVREVTDPNGNAWYEVDVPKDINTRLLIFNTLGQINLGSLNLNALREAWKSIQPSK